MGLDFGGANAHWSYGGFNRFRERLAQEIGITLGDMEGFGGTVSWHNIRDPIKPLLNHSDCDGHLTPRQCDKIAPRLLSLVLDWDDSDYDKRQAVALAEGMMECARHSKRLIFC